MSIQLLRVWRKSVWPVMLRRTEREIEHPREKTAQHQEGQPRELLVPEHLAILETPQLEQEQPQHQLRHLQRKGRELKQKRLDPVLPPPRVLSLTLPGRDGLRVVGRQRSTFLPAKELQERPQSVEGLPQQERLRKHPRRFHPGILITIMEKGQGGPVRRAKDGSRPLPTPTGIGEHVRYICS